MDNSFVTFKGLRSSNGLSLIEVMTTMAVATILLTISLGEIAKLNNLRMRVEAVSDSKVEAHLVVRYLNSYIRQLGGNFVRPWMALLVEDNCTARGNLPECHGSDRLTYASLARNFNFCKVISTTGGNRLNFDASSDVCCNSNREGQQMVLVKDDHFSHFFIKATGYDAGNNVCYIDVENGQLSLLNASHSVPQFSDWAEADLAVTRVETIYYDQSQNSIRKRREKVDGTNDEDLLISDQILDFQVALGYDAQPQDGQCFDDRSDQDEWLYNYNSNSEALGIGGLTTAKSGDLRMINIGVLSHSNYGTTQNKITDTSRDTQLLNGPDRRAEGNLTFMSTALNRFYLRSSYLFSE